MAKLEIPNYGRVEYMPGDTLQGVEDSKIDRGGLGHTHPRDQPLLMHLLELISPTQLLWPPSEGGWKRD